jgi:hypothetical protein
MDEVTVEHLLRTTSIYIHTLDVGHLVTYLRPFMFAQVCVSREATFTSRHFP